MLCPLGKLEEVGREGFAFYSPKKKEHGSTPWKGDNPTFDQLQQMKAGKFFDMVIDGELWHRIPLDVTWELAEDDANYPCTNSEADPKPSPRHIHCEFELLSNVIHVDLISIMSWGPLSGFEEFQFFLNGQFQSQGGYFACYGIWSGNMPPCLWTKTLAIIAHERGFSGSVLPSNYQGLSAWIIGEKHKQWK